MAGLRTMAPAVVLIVFSAAISGCGGDPVTAKLTAEEKGYLSRFEPALRTSCLVGTTIERQEGYTAIPLPCVSDPNGRPRRCEQIVPRVVKVDVQVLADAYQNAAEMQRELAISLPPTGLATAHRQFLGALATERLPGRPGSIGQMRRTCNSFRAFLTSVETREQRFAAADAVYLSFSPAIGPTATYDSLEGWRVEESISVPVPHGSITAGHREARGVHALHLIFRGRRRIFILDRPFELYLPPRYGTRVSYRGGDEILIYILDR
jgi:hypothetical protein